MAAVQGSTSIERLSDTSIRAHFKLEASNGASAAPRNNPTVTVLRDGDVYQQATASARQPIYLFDYSNLSPGKYRVEIEFKGDWPGGFDFPVTLRTGEVDMPQARQPLDASIDIDTIDMQTARYRLTAGVAGGKAPYTFTWSFSNVIPQLKGQTVNIQWPRNGVFTISLVVRDSLDKAVIRKHEMVITQLPKEEPPKDEPPKDEPPKEEPIDVPDMIGDFINDLIAGTVATTEAALATLDRRVDDTVEALLQSGEDSLDFVQNNIFGLGALLLEGLTRMFFPSLDDLVNYQIRTAEAIVRAAPTVRKIKRGE